MCSTKTLGEWSLGSRPSLPFHAVYIFSLSGLQYLLHPLPPFHPGHPLPPFHPELCRTTLYSLPLTSLFFLPLSMTQLRARRDPFYYDSKTFKITQENRPWGEPQKMHLSAPFVH